MKLLLLLLPALAASQKLLGAPEKVNGKLTTEQQGIVDFAFAQITLGDASACSRKVVDVTDFTQQVVAGTLYSFKLVLDYDGLGNCPALASGKSCAMKVIDVPWDGGKKVLWDEVSCQRNVQEVGVGVGVPGAPVVVENLNADQQSIVDFAFSQLTMGDSVGCARTYVTVEDFTEQVVAGTLYKFKLVLNSKGGSNCPAVVNGKSCAMEVIDVPWEGGKKVIWENSKCQRNVQEKSNNIEFPVAGAPVLQEGGFFSEQLNVISFAVADLIAGDSPSCPRKVLSVSNFKEQVVSGTLYTFDLVLKTVNMGNCPVGYGEGKCTMKVIDTPWDGGKKVLKEDSTCERDIQELVG